MLIDQRRVDPRDPHTAVEQMLSSVEKHFSLDEEQSFRIKLVAQELLNNIIYHARASLIEMRCYASGGA